MKCNVKRNLFTVICAVMCTLALGAAGCSKKQKEASIDFSSIQSFRDIPGVTAQEIAAIEKLKSERDSFIYGATPSNEAFMGENGDITGYTALFCEWLTKIFGIKFNVRIMEWIELTEKRSTGDIDFSLYFLSGDDNLENYYVSDPIAERQFIITHLAGSPGISEIMRERKPRYAFSMASPTESSIAAVLGRDSYEAVWANHYSEIYGILERG